MNIQGKSIAIASWHLGVSAYIHECAFYPKPVGRRDRLSIWRWRFGTGSVISRDLIILSFPLLGHILPSK